MTVLSNIEILRFVKQSSILGYLICSSHVICFVLKACKEGSAEMQGTEGGSQKSVPWFPRPGKGDGNANQRRVGDGCIMAILRITNLDG